MVYQCEKQLNELGDKAPKELKETIDGILSESKKVLENQDSSLAELKDAKDSLQKTFEQLGQEAMKHAGSTGAAGTSTESENKASSDSEKSDTKSKEEDIVDADFEVVDEADKKE
jgi:molecular chaperone DnaK